MRTFKPLNDMILVEPEHEEDSNGPLMKSDHTLVKPMFGTVISIGPGRLDIPMNVIKGERVTFPQLGGRNITLEDGKEYLIIRQGELFGTYD